MDISIGPLLNPAATQLDHGSNAQRLADALTGPGDQTAGGLERAAQAFEAYFISYLLQSMRATVPKGLLPNKGGEFFRSFYDQELGRLAAEAGGLGLAEVLQDHLAGREASIPLKEGLKSYAHSSDTIPDMGRSSYPEGVGGIGREE